MKKSKSLLAVAFVLVVGILTGCGKTSETVTSSFSEGHLTVQQTTNGIRLVVNKTADEDINRVTVVDANNGYSASASLKSTLSTSFPWPFVEKGKEYTLTAQLFGDEAYTEDTVTFKVENDCSSILKYSEAYENSRLKLIADGSKRLVKIESTKENLLSSFASKNVENLSLRINVYSGNRKELAPNELVGISTLSSTMEDNLFKIMVKDGYDLIANAKDFGLSPSKINAEFSKQSKYFASAVIYFTVKNGDSDVEYGTSPLYTNDTVYTPIAEEDLPYANITSAADAK